MSTKRAVYRELYNERGLELPSRFAIPPSRANSVRNFPADIIRSDASQARILILSGFPDLVEKFLAYKRQHGTTKEKQLYANMTAGQEIARLYRNRPLAFLNSSDDTVLRYGRRINSAARSWDAVGTDSEQVITLSEYLSYDEIMLGSFMGASSPSYFVNNGSRNNSGRPGAPGSFETRGIIVGLVGARFERPEHMDSNLILLRSWKDEQQKPSQQDPELTKIFLDFLGVKKEGFRFEGEVYIARMKIPIGLLLLEAQRYAEQESPSKMAYVYVVGLGLGVWKFDDRQPLFYVEAIRRVLVELKGSLSRIATIEIAWVDVDKVQERYLTETAREMGIKVKFSRRNPAAKLVDGEENQLLVLSYAWDANAYPGNEYWIGSLTASGDPAAAAMSTIAEIHNPEINPNIWRPYESL
ncbi:hypothetical protein F4820DRAFT_418134 [Hypoxylon rubiginosum]|uniref:Uncharacterized protein n=1 Tax=Hypoxylon rubiginosum TaxID=110542 RepID=A0ACB9Z321_9PEZI|nr:hypothetical protein F4820DRAFT_418134 [Hypoxylon rubiginosum]